MAPAIVASIIGGTAGVIAAIIGAGGAVGAAVINNSGGGGGNDANDGGSTTTTPTVPVVIDNGNGWEVNPANEPYMNDVLDMISGLDLDLKRNANASRVHSLRPALQAHCSAELALLARNKERLKTLLAESGISSWTDFLQRVSSLQRVVVEEEGIPLTDAVEAINADREYGRDGGCLDAVLRGGVGANIWG